MTDQGSTITFETVLRALTRAAPPIAAFAVATFVAALLDRTHLASVLVSIGAALAVAGATTAAIEAPLLATSHSPRTLGTGAVRARTAIATAVGAALGALCVLQMIFMEGLIVGGTVQAGLGRFDGNVPELMVLLTLGAVSVAVPLGVVTQHRLTLDGSDRLEGTPGPVNQALVRSALLASPLCFAALVAPVIASILLYACRVDEWVTRRRARWFMGGGARDLKARLERGSLTAERLELAAYAGHPGASAIGPTPFTPHGLEGWAEGLRVFGIETCVRAASAGLGVAVPAHERAHGGDLARVAWLALEAWLARPGAETLAAASAAADAITPTDAPTARAARAVASAASRTGPFATTAAARDTAASLVAAGEATGDDGVVRAAACQALQAWALEGPRSSQASISGNTSGSANG